MRALGDEVVYHHADKPLCAVDGVLAESERAARGVCTRDKPQRGGLLIAGRAEELSRAVETVHLFGHQRGRELGRVGTVVLDGVGGSGELGVLETFDGAHQRELDVLRQRRTQSLEVELAAVQLGRLDEHRMARLVGEAHDLVLDRGAVARAGAHDVAAVERRAVKVVAYYLMCALVGVGQVADRAVRRQLGGEEAERREVAFAVLHRHAAEIDGGRVDARGSAGLEAAYRQSERDKRLGQRVGGEHPVGTRRAGVVADEYLSAKERARRDDHAFCAEQCAERGLENKATGGVGGLRFNANRPNLRLLQPQVGLTLERVLHVQPICRAVGLRAGRADGGTLAASEHSELDAAGIGGACHLTAERVHLADQTALRAAAYRRIAGHIAHRVEVYREHHRACADARRRERGFDARVTRADDGNVKLSGEIFHNFTSTRTDSGASSRESSSTENRSQVAMSKNVPRGTFTVWGEWEEFRTRRTSFCDALFAPFGD